MSGSNGNGNGNGHKPKGNGKAVPVTAKELSAAVEADDKLTLSARASLKPNQLAMIEAYPECGTIRGACRKVKISRQTHYDWMKTVPAYALLFEEEAKPEFVEVLEEEARDRALNGSDNLLMFMLRAHAPEKYHRELEKMGMDKGRNRQPIGSRYIFKTRDGQPKPKDSEPGPDIHAN